MSSECASSSISSALSTSQRNNTSANPSASNLQLLAEACLLLPPMPVSRNPYPSIPSMHQPAKQPPQIFGISPISVKPLPDQQRADLQRRQEALNVRQKNLDLDFKLLNQQLDTGLISLTAEEQERWEKQQAIAQQRQLNLDLEQRNLDLNFKQLAQQVIGSTNDQNQKGAMKNVDPLKTERYQMDSLRRRIAKLVREGYQYNEDYFRDNSNQISDPSPFQWTLNFVNYRTNIRYTTKGVYYDEIKTG